MRPKLKLHLALYEQQKVGPLLVVASAFSGLNDLKKKEKKKKKKKKKLTSIETTSRKTTISPGMMLFLKQIINKYPKKSW